MGKSQHLFAKEMSGRGREQGMPAADRSRRVRCRDIGVTLGSKEGGSEKR